MLTSSRNAVITKIGANCAEMRPLEIDKNLLKLTQNLKNTKSVENGLVSVVWQLEFQSVSDVNYGSDEST